jgi:hypothetical protein
MNDPYVAIFTIVLTLGSLGMGAIIWNIPGLLIGVITGLVVKSVDKTKSTATAVKIGIVWTVIIILAGSLSLVLNFLLGDVIGTNFIVTWILTFSPLALLCPLIGCYFTFKWLSVESNNGANNP